MNGKLTATLSARGRLKATLSKAIERVEPIIKPIEVTENGEYTAPENVHGFNPVKVDVPIRYEEGYQDGYKAMQDGLQEKEITANGEYTADEGHTGFKKVNVNVSFDNIGKPFIDTSKMTSFYYFCYSGVNLEVLDGIDTSNSTRFDYMFYNCKTLLKTVPHMDTSKGVVFTRMFDSCTDLTTIPPLDLSSGEQFDYMFRNCVDLTTTPQLDISNGKRFISMFGYCTSLETVSITTAKSNLSTDTFQGCTALKNITIGEGWAVNIYLHYSNNLTVESLHGMIENLADLTGLTAKTFQVGANIAKIDQTHLDMLVAKNWNYS